MTGWRLKTNIDVQRGAPIETDDGPVAGPTAISGQAYIVQGAGALEKFPYRLTDIDAHLSFEGDALTLHYLNGYGPEQATVSVKGAISPLLASGADLTVTARDVPLDEHLRAALNEGQQRVFDALLDEVAASRLLATGVLPNAPADHDAARAELAAAITARSEAPAAEGDPALEDLRRALRRLDRLEDAGAFEVGGVVDLALDIHRPPGRGERTVITGAVDVQRAGVVLDRFPYPVQVTGGRIEWHEDRLEIPAPTSEDDVGGLRLVTPAGGAGLLAGAIHFERDGTTMRSRPDLRLVVRDDLVNDALLAALPLDEDAPEADRATWPGGVRSGAARLLEALVESGELHYEGHVRIDESGRLDYDFAVDLERVVAQPTPELADVLGLAGAPWPDDLRVHHGVGRARVTRDLVELTAFEGEHAGGLVRSTVRLARRPERDVDVTIDADGLPLGPFIARALPKETRGPIAAELDRYRPAGHATATIRYTARGDDDPGSLRIDVQPVEISARLATGPVTFRHLDGGVTVTDGTLETDGLVLGVDSAGKAAGRLALAITGAPDTAERRFECRWTGGAFESPVTSEVLQRSAGQAVRDAYASYAPQGRFDVEATYAPATGDYRVVLTPSSLGVELDGTASAMQLKPGTEVVVTPGLVDLRQLTGAYRGVLFDVAGTVVTGGAIDAELQLTLDGPLRGEVLTALMPDAARTVLDALDYRDGASTRLSDGRLRFTQLGPEVDGTPPWRTAFYGTLRTRGAALDAGVPFDDMEARFEIDLHHVAGEVPRVEVLVSADRLRVAGCELTNFSTPVLLSEDGTEVLIPRFGADVYGGRLAAEARVGVGDHRAYEVRLDLAGGAAGAAHRRPGHHGAAPR